MAKGEDVDEGEMKRMRVYAEAASKQPPGGWGPAYAFAVPKLLAEIEYLSEARRRLDARLRFAEMVLDRNVVRVDGLPWREAARLREAADGIDKPETEAAPEHGL